MILAPPNVLSVRAKTLFGRSKNAFGGAKTLVARAKNLFGGAKRDFGYAAELLERAASLGGPDAWLV